MLVYYPHPDITVCKSRKLIPSNNILPKKIIKHAARYRKQKTTLYHAVIIKHLISHREFSSTLSLCC